MPHLGTILFSDLIFSRRLADFTRFSTNLEGLPKIPAQLDWFQIGCGAATSPTDPSLPYTLIVKKISLRINQGVINHARSAIELTYEDILEAASKLSEDKERLFFSLNKDYAKASDETQKEA